MLNEKHIEGELEHIKCASHYKKKCSFKLLKAEIWTSWWKKKKSNIISIDKELATQAIMDPRTTADKLKARLEFK